MANSGVVYIHMKTGKSYLTLLEGVLHTETQELLTIYTNTAGQLFARPQAVFHDGRFATTAIEPEVFLWKS